MSLLKLIPLETIILFVLKGGGSEIVKLWNTAKHEVLKAQDTGLEGELRFQQVFTRIMNLFGRELGEGKKGWVSAAIQLAYFFLKTKGFNLKYAPKPDDK